MIKKITRAQRNKIVNKLINSSHKTWARLSNMLYSGDINFSDTFHKSYDWYSDSDITFVIDSAAGCRGDAGLSPKESKIFTLLELS